MLEALYDKTCLTKCFGNFLEMNFEYLNVSVAQKLTELQFFRSHQVYMLEALYDKTCLPKCVRNSLQMQFEYINVSVAQNLTKLGIIGWHQLLTAVIHQSS